MKYLLIACLLSLSLFPSFVKAKDFTPKECPFVGNTNSKIYHSAGGNSYAKMLRENQSGDNRRCFSSASQAQAAGYRASQR
jgi:methylphosphotriester-DNA--protein-cysteine methyltransferase